MKYKVGQRFRIRTLEEVKEIYPQKEWNKIFFDNHANTTFVVERVDINANGNLTLSGTGTDNSSLRIRTKYNEGIVLKPYNCIELDNNLFEL